jgi:hypothetical protein
MGEHSASYWSGWPSIVGAFLLSIPGPAGLTKRSQTFNCSCEQQQPDLNLLQESAEKNSDQKNENAIREADDVPVPDDFSQQLYEKWVLCAHMNCLLR